MAKSRVICPVCGKVNDYERFSEYNWGTVEQHYYCDRCTYFVEQVYSPVAEGISSDCPEEYKYKAKLLDLTVYAPEDVPF